MTTFNETRRSAYAADYQSATIRPEHAAAIEAEARKVLLGRKRYEVVALATGVPWGVIGVLHARESDCDFSTHLHNGDKLTARTHHVPAGRPPWGDPPFDWTDSAEDALRFDKINEIAEPGQWDISAAAAACETFNGFGYRRYGMVDPYLWAGTTLYDKGKFTADGLLDHNAIDSQPGAMAVLQVLLELAPDALSERQPAPSPESALHKSRTLLGTVYITAGAYFSLVKASLFGFVAAMYSGAVDLLSSLPDIQAQVLAIRAPVEDLVHVAGKHLPADFGLAVVLMAAALVAYARFDAALNHKVG